MNRKLQFNFSGFTFFLKISEVFEFGVKVFFVFSKEYINIVSNNDRYDISIVKNFLIKKYKKYIKKLF